MALSRAPESPTFYGPASGGAYRYSPGNPPRVRGGAHDELHDLAGHPAGQLGGTRGGHRAPLPAGQRVDAGATPLPADVLDRAITAARLASTAELNVNDVIEAGAAVDPAVVEAMLVETQASFALDRRTLLQLDDSGVPAEVIDLMVALSFPDEFVVERPPARTAASFGGCGGGFVDPFSPYGFDLWYPYYASPFGYYYGWSPYNSLYYLGPAVSYVIVPDVLDGGSPGRAYRGRGYSQIGVREPTTDRRAQRRTVPGGTTGTAAEPRGGGSAGTSGSSDGGQATPGGYTRGGSSGRTARPRDR